MFASVFIVAALSTVAAAPQGASPGGPATLATGAPDAWPLATVELGGMAGYAWGTVFEQPRQSTSFSQGLVRFAFLFGATGDGAMRGNFALVAEGVGMWVDQDPRAAGGGLNLLLRYTWAVRRWRPMVTGGAGILYSDQRIPPGETTRNFTPQVGVGLQYLISRSIALDVEYRFHHLSNKGRTETNPGINSNLVLFGVSWYR